MKVDILDVENSHIVHTVDVQIGGNCYHGVVEYCHKHGWTYDLNDADGNTITLNGERFEELTDKIMNQDGEEMKANFLVKINDELFEYWDPCILLIDIGQHGNPDCIYERTDGALKTSYKEITMNYLRSLIR